MRNGEYGVGIDVGGGAVSAAVCRPDGEAVPPAGALLHDRYLVLRRGKRTFAGVEVLR